MSVRQKTSTGWINTTGVNLDNYSTDEQVIGKWIDGKPIYRKVIQSIVPDCVTNGTSANVDIDLNILNIGQLVKLQATFIGPTYSASIPFYSGDTPQNGVRAYLFHKTSGTGVQIRNSSIAYNGFTIYVFIEYTKTVV